MMNRFSIGQHIIALTNASNSSLSQERVKGKIYTVLSIKYCSNCGVQKVNTKGFLPYMLSNGCRPAPKIQCDCGKDYTNDGLWWTASSEFAPIDEIDNLLNSAIEQEDYELAAGLRDIKQL